MGLGTEIALIKALGGGSGGGLPEVTSADAGKVLGVNDSGVWGAQEPIGKKFIVTLTPTSESGGTMDKTVAEINAAYEAGKMIGFSLAVGGTTYETFAISRKFAGGSNFDFTATSIIGENLLRVATQNDPVSYEFTMTLYTLTPAT